MASRLFVTAAVLSLLCCAVQPATVRAQGGSDSIFQRFAMDRNPRRNWQSMLELPVQLRPINNPGADMVDNVGFGYTLSYGPQNRIYSSRTFHWAKMEWKPEEPNVAKERVIEFGVSDSLNFRVYRWLVMYFGIGLAVMDGTIIFRDDEGFQTRLEPFIPVHVGMVIPLGSRWVLGFKLAQSTYFGPGPGLSVTRLLVGLGINY